MQNIKSLFEAIGRSDVNENMQYILSNGVIDSLDVIQLIVQIEKIYGKNLSHNYIISENFENFKAIDEMIKQAYKSK